MLEALAQLSPAYEILFLGAVAVMAWKGAHCWWKFYQTEQDRAFKKELLAQHYSIVDIERLVPSSKNQPPVLMVPFPATLATSGFRPPQDGAGVSQPETAAPAAGETSPGGMSFGYWYEQRFADTPLVLQVLSWLLYGYLWIPLCYLALRPRVNPTDAVQAKKSAVLPFFVGAALFVAVLFPSISVLVHVASADSRQQRSQVLMLAPECCVVPVEAGGDGSCRIVIGPDHFAAGDGLELTARVIAQSSPTGSLQVETKPGRVRMCSGSSSYITVNLHAGQGLGYFTVQVTAVDRLNKCAATTFTVQVRPAVATESPSQHD